MSSNYACIASTEGGARCRNWAMGKGTHDLFCGLHAALAVKAEAVGRTIATAPLPNAALMVFLEPWTIDDCILGKLEDLGVPAKEQDRQRKEAKHTAHAEQFRRDPNTYRANNPDSGAKVFESKLQNVRVLPLCRDLFGRYSWVNPHIQWYPDRPELNRLIIAFGDKKPENGIPELSQEAWEAIDGFVSHTMSTGEVWANPPRDSDGAVIHSLKFARPNHNRAAGELEFANGLWRMSPYRVSAKA